MPFSTACPPAEKEVHPSGNTPYEEWLYRHIDGIGDNVIIAFDWDGSRFRMRKDPSQPRRADAIFHGLSARRERSSSLGQYSLRGVALSPHRRHRRQRDHRLRLGREPVSHAQRSESAAARRCHFPRPVRPPRKKFIPRAILPTRSGFIATSTASATT